MVYGLLEFYNSLQDENSNDPNVFDVKFANVLLSGIVKNHTLMRMNGFDESNIALSFATGIYEYSTYYFISYNIICILSQLKN